MRRAGWIVTGLWLLGLITGSALPAAETTEAVEARLLEAAKYLADDALEGRGVGTAGIDVAAKYLTEQFGQMGLNVTAVNGGALQTFDLITSAELGEGNQLTLIDPQGMETPLAMPADFEVCSFGGSGTFDAEVVFAGYGIEDGDSKYNDFAAVDVKGKLVLIMRRNPGQRDPHGPFAGPHGMSRHAELRTKVSQAVQHGAIGVLLVNDPYSIEKAGRDRGEALTKLQVEVAELADAFLAVAPESAEDLRAAREKLAAAVTRWKDLKQTAATANDDVLMKFGYAGHSDKVGGIPVFHITQAQANKLLKSGLGKTLVELEQAIDAAYQPQSAVVPGWKVRGAANVIKVESKVSNVIAVLEGEGPLADETLVIGAHYDHVGRGGQNSLAPGSSEIHNGADDNASGTAALLELARRLSARPEKLARRLVFIAFTGEELGLLGSAVYVKEPTFPLDKTIAMFNMDMVGRLQDDKLTIFGSGTSPRWESELNAINERTTFKLSFKPEGFGPSDHSSFYGKQIPVLHFFTGNHPDYHRPSDDWEKLNVPGMARVVSMLEALVVQTANNPERPAYVEVKQAPTTQRGGNRPYFGTIPDFGGEGEGYAISGAAPGSPAELGGLKGGDRIIELGGNKITALDDFDLALRKFKGGDEVTVIVLRDKQPVTLKVKLGPPR